MKSEIIDFGKRVSHIVGMKISHIWMGYGSHFYMELGHLTDSGYDNNPNGEASITLGSTWNLSLKSRVLGGSSNSYPIIEKSLKKLVGEVIVEIQVLKDSQELKVLLSNGTSFHSTTNYTGYPDWSIKLSNGFYISIDDDTVSIATGDHPGKGLSSKEEKRIEYSRDVTSRWGKPSLNNENGECWNCNLWVRLDGPSYYLDYGVCSSSKSLFDGKVTNSHSGCGFYQE